jgi:endoplasmic reticulum junction formation protein lunapark
VYHRRRRPQLTEASQGDRNSAESFERTLAALATKITKTAAQNDSLRQRARKLKVGWTLYAGFAYILAFLILTLVTGWRNWGPVEYTVVSGGPLVCVLCVVICYGKYG